MSKLLARLAICAAVFQLSAAPVCADELLGQPAPDFALRSINGDNLRLSEYRSEVVVLTFWSDWCGKCRSALPVLDSLHRRYEAEGLRMLAVDVDGDLGKAKAFAAENDVNFPVLADIGQDVSRRYELNQMPLSVVLDREGNVRYVHKGFSSDEGELLAAEVTELLKE
jgi:peroxiredoxin